MTSVTVIGNEIEISQELSMMNNSRRPILMLLFLKKIWWTKFLFKRNGSKMGKNGKKEKYL